jgi:hypothetical protein
VNDALKGLKNSANWRSFIKKGLAVTGTATDGLFIGQSKEFFELLRDLAEDADEAKREQ